MGQLFATQHGPHYQTRAVTPRLYGQFGHGTMYGSFLEESWGDRFANGFSI